MQLRINGSLVDFIPIKLFREQFHLPDSFGVETFQPKDLEGLGSIDRAGQVLNEVKTQMVAAVPSSVPANDWLAVVPQLAAAFEGHLNRINASVGLRDEEIAFAVNGFGDVCSAAAFAIVRSRLTGGVPPRFEQIYSEWLYGTVSIGGVYYDYVHNGEDWVIRVVLHAYGRIGLEIRTPQKTFYVVDKTLACPAEGYMVNLLESVVNRMMAVTV